jgi:hypothetical protein
VAAYLDAVRSRLADLPVEERDDLVADVEASLLEAGEPPTLSPEDFATELREAAGLAPETATSSQQSLLDSVRVWLATDRGASLVRTAHELAPLWWALRAYVIVVLVALATGQGWPVGSGSAYTIVSLDTSIVVLILAAAVSTWLGLRGRRQPSPHRRLARVANVGLALAVLPVAAFSLNQLDYWNYAQSYVTVEPSPGLALDGEPIRNLYPYSREGTPLFDVLLYDEAGRAISVLSGPEDTSRRVLADANGTQLFNSFPIRYYEPGTRTVARPGLAPPITVPKVATPPLELAPK